jgi:hypothetical protein
MIPPEILYGHYGNSESTLAYSIALDKNNNVFVCGNFDGTSLTFGNNTVTNASSSTTDSYIVKIDNTGTPGWIRSSSQCADYDEAKGVATDPSGNIYITGFFSAISIHFGNQNIMAGGFYLVKYDSSGAVIFAKGTNSGGGEGRGVACDTSGNVYVTGDFNPVLTFGSINLSTHGDADIFVAKFNSSGTVQWLQGAGGPTGDIPKSICIDEEKNAYITGSYFSNFIDFGSVTVDDYGSGDIFVAKIGDLPAAVNELNTSDDIIIFPNPSQGKIWIKNIKNEPSVRMVIYNNVGEIVCEENVNSLISDNGILIQPSLADGLYVISIFSVKNCFTKKLFISHN